MNMSNTSIQIGEGGIANDDNPFGAIFFKGDSEGNSGDAVFSGNNVVFNGIAFWELAGETNDNGKNEIDIQNGQGCAQFIGDTVLHSDSRFNLCTVSTGEQPDLLDFGDLTDNYQTLLASNGPSHVINPNIQIGALIDDETDGQPSANADGDGNDEDGVTIPTLTAGENATFEVDVTNNTGSDATLYGFIDWNNDGDFDDTGETATTTVSDGTTNGTANLNFSVPNGAATDTPVGARFRLSTDSGLDATGAASDGEVEDYLVTVQEAPVPSIDIEKSTNGEDADTPTGPILSEGDTATFTYNVTNDGDVGLENVVVTDDQDLVPVAVDADNDTFNDGDTNQDNILDPGETWEYTASTTVTAGQYTNIGSVTADPVGGGETVTDSDPSNHFGACLFETVFNEKLGSTDEAIDVVIGYGADFNGDGLKDIQVTLRVADASNSSTEDMIGVAFDIDDQNLINTLGLTIDDITTYANGNSGTSDSVINSPVAGTDFIIGPDAVDSNNLLGVNLSGGGVDRPYDALVKFGNGGQGDGIVQEGSFIISGTQDLTDDLIREILEQTDWYVRLQSTNGGNGSAKTAGFISEIPDKDPPPANPSIDIEKSTNGVDADTPTGPVVPVGSTATFTYSVENTGNVPLDNVQVTDDQGVDVTAVETNGFNDGDTNQNNILDPDEIWQYTGSTTVTPGQYTNIGTVTADDPDDNQVTDNDPSNHFGEAAPAIDIEKSTNDVDADTPTGPEIEVGDTANFEYVVTNPGNTALADVTVTDDQGVTVTPTESGGFNVGDTDNDGLLDPGETWRYTGSTTVTEGQYTNIGTVTGNPVDENGDPLTNPDGSDLPNVEAEDPSNHIGISEPTPNIIDGTSGMDMITGTPERDIITGFEGMDMITGGGGNDDFVYKSFLDQTDYIMDFQTGSDQLDLSLLLANETNFFTAFPAGNAQDAIDEGYVIVTDYGANGSLVQADPDGLAGPGFVENMAFLVGTSSANGNAFDPTTDLIV
ncbi:MAG: hypothetical protein F6K18_05795 [Okeania sp. SIO2C2]|uniref:beta strand repeat-containing protein n=1 Tax=Okeania sp. SIO2C2 TaxID=2607787 RepID=UPI0013B7783C|nr:GEVED domain-containing protein [Okeania sp. SIO2C2]NEP86372.1 hypothetical protein [Okeania sp. SIO2C2]